MTIAERKAREAHDRENPWRPMHPLPPVGLIVDLLFDDWAGHHSPDGIQFFMDANGRWYRIKPERWIAEEPMNWRPSWVTLTPERRSVVRNRAGDKSCSAVAKPAAGEDNREL